MNDLEYWQSNVGPGWAALVAMAWTQCQARGATITIVKEKFGLLRIYVYDGDEHISDALEALEALSAYVCENCGKPGHPRGGGWIKTLCDECEGGRHE